MTEAEQRSHNELYEAVGELRGTLSAMNEKLDEIMDKLKTQNGRLGKLEIERAKLAGVGIGLGAGAGGLAGGLASVLQRLFH